MPCRNTLQEWDIFGLEQVVIVDVLVPWTKLVSAVGLGTTGTISFGLMELVFFGFNIFMTDSYYNVPI